MPNQLFEDDVRKAGRDTAAAKAWAEANGKEWVPSQTLATPAPTSAPTAAPQGGTYEQGFETLRGQPPPNAVTQYGSIYPFNPSPAEKIGLRMLPAMGLPALGGAVAGGGILSQMAGQGVGMLANEGLNYATQPPEERPTLGGAALRTAVGVGAIGGLGYLANKFAPALGKGGEAIPKPVLPPEPTPAVPAGMRALPPTPTPTPVPERVPRSVATELGQTIKDKVDDVFSGLQEEVKIKSDEIRKVAQEVGDDSMVDVKPIIKRLKTFFGNPDEVATLNPSEDAARNELIRRAGEIEKEAALSGGRISLDRAYRALTKFGARGYEGSPEAKSEIVKAYKILRAELKEGVEQHIAKVAPGSAKIIKDANRIIHSKLTAAEDLDEFLTSDPAVVVSRLRNIPKAREALTGLDKVFGTNFTSTLDDYSAKVAEVEKLRKLIPEVNREAAKAARTTSKAISTENLAQEQAAKAISKIQSQEYLAHSKSVTERYEAAVKAADEAKARAMKAATIVSKLLGGAIGFSEGEKLGFPGSRWVGATAGYTLGAQMPKVAAHGIVKGSRLLAPIVYPTEVAINTPEPEDARE
jgi:hypothetical protein